MFSQAEQLTPPRKLSIPINSTLVSSCKTTLETFAKDFKVNLSDLKKNTMLLSLQRVPKLKEWLCWYLQLKWHLHFRLVSPSQLMPKYVRVYKVTHYFFWLIDWLMCTRWPITRWVFSWPKLFGLCIEILFTLVQLWQIRAPSVSTSKRCTTEWNRRKRNAQRSRLEIQWLFLLFV